MFFSYIMCYFCSWCFQDLPSMFGFQRFDHDVPWLWDCSSFFYLMSFGFLNFWVFKSNVRKYFYHFLLSVFSLFFWDSNYTYVGTWYLCKRFRSFFIFNLFSLYSSHWTITIDLWVHLLYYFHSTIKSIQWIFYFRYHIFPCWNFHLVLSVFISLMKFSIFLIHWIYSLFYFIRAIWKSLSATSNIQFSQVLTQLIFSSLENVFHFLGGFYVRKIWIYNRICEW